MKMGNKKGFSVIELMVVTVITGVLGVRMAHMQKDQAKAVKTLQGKAEVNQLVQQLGIMLNDEVTCSANFGFFIDPANPSNIPTTGNMLVPALPAGTPVTQIFGVQRKSGGLSGENRRNPTPYLDITGPYSGPTIADNLDYDITSMRLSTDNAIVVAGKSDFWLEINGVRKNSLAEGSGTGVGQSYPVQDRIYLTGLFDATGRLIRCGGNVADDYLSQVCQTLGGTIADIDPGPGVDRRCIINCNGGAPTRGMLDLVNAFAAAPGPAVGFPAAITNAIDGYVSLLPTAPSTIPNRELYDFLLISKECAFPVLRAMDDHLQRKYMNRRVAAPYPVTETMTGSLTINPGNLIVPSSITSARMCINNATNCRNQLGGTCPTGPGGIINQYLVGLDVLPNPLLTCRNPYPAGDFNPPPGCVPRCPSQAGVCSGNVIRVYNGCGALCPDVSGTGICI